ncbi:unnamed protein product [Cylindrotheca closterium]|uniref:Glutathione transferase n=1 Tax=Cylindrotheca closterium TaxID=2856 RepID=A0AAD2FPL5_9STRA|nr:unnamed protein product [Cylindrotheca closterium]
MMASTTKAAQFEGDALWPLAWKESFGEQTIRQRSYGATDTTTTATTLFCSWFCPFAQRAWIALEEKDVPYRYQEINPYEVDPTEIGGYTKKPLPLEEKGKKYPGFLDCSPRGLVPALQVDGEDHTENVERVWESLPIIEYIDERFETDASLMPKSPIQRAQARIWADFVTARVQKAYYTMLMDQDPDGQQKAKDNFRKEVATFSNAMAPLSEGPYFFGSHFTLVDIALAPFWQRFLWVGKHYRGLDVDGEDATDRVKEWWKAVSERPSVQRTMVGKERLIASYKQYSTNEGTSDYAQGVQSGLTSKKRQKTTTTTAGN